MSGSDLTASRQEAIRKLLESAAANRPDGPSARRSHAPAPLSPAQETLWLTDRVSPGAATYNVPFGLRLSGALDTDALLTAVRRIVARHRQLRMSVRSEGDQFLQVFTDGVEDVEVVDAAHADEATTAMHREAARGFDLTRPPLWRLRLYRVSADEHYFFFNAHHIVFDGWSSGIFFEELGAEYTAAATGTDAGLTAPELEYDDFSEWQRGQLRDDRFREDIRYWRDYLADLGVLDLATDRPLPTEITFPGDTVVRPVPGLAPAARALAERLGVTAYAVHSALVATVLDRFAESDEVVFAIPGANRGFESIERIIGFFVNVLPIRCPVDDATSFEALARRCHVDIREAAARSHVPFETIVHEVRPRRDPARQPLFQVGMALEEWGGTPVLGDLGVSEVPLHAESSRYQMSWVVTPGDGDDDASVSVEFNTDLFDRATVESMIHCLGTLAAAVAADPAVVVRDVPLLDAEATRAEIARGIAPTREPRVETVTDRFSATVAAHGDRIAVVAEDGEATYDDLARRAHRIAARIRERVPTPRGAHIAVLTERTRDLPATVLAILGCGAVYVPVDASNPPARAAEIVEDSDAELLVAHPHLVGELGGTVPVLELTGSDDDADASPGDAPGDALSGAASPEDPAYVMYTSGSTGRPKGVVVTHANVADFIQNTIDLFELTPADRVLGYASVGFDVSVFELFAALFTGASIHYVPTDKRLDMDHVQRFVAEQEITVTDLPPSVMSLLDPEDFTALRIVFVGGEPFSSELVDRWAPGRRFFNGYGVTECTVTMTVHECTPGTYVATPPIGAPMVNHVAHVLDARGNVAPPGTVGELVISGSGLAVGYHRREEATREAFVEDRLGSSREERLYRTGDLVRRNGDGELVYVRRRDSQIKINGVRIEPGEVEWAMRTHPQVAQAHALTYDGQHGTSLAGYYTAAGDGVTEADLRAYLKNRLVPAMVPTALVALDEMPLTGSGKVDRARLPVPTPRTDEPTRGLRPGLEEEIWSEIYRPILGIDGIRPEDDFFELGGASLQAAQVISRVRRRFDVELPLSRFFVDSSVAAVALHVERAQLGRLSEAELGERLARMSDEDVDRLLADG